jgi:hypothetical protein
MMTDTDIEACSSVGGAPNCLTRRHPYQKFYFYICRYETAILPDTAMMQDGNRG